MTIRKGQPWGTAGALPTDGVVVRSDRAARHLVEQARDAGRPPPVVGLLGGDLCRTLGGSGDEARLRSAEAMTFCVDVAEADVDGGTHCFVAHLVAHRRSWRHIYLALNAEWYRGLDVGPRSHPGDGLLDTYDARLGLSDLLAVRARARHGAHLPHPGIRERRTAAVEVDFGHTMVVELDGEAVGRARRVALRVARDALQVVV